MKILLLAPHPFFQQRGTPIAERMLLTILTAHGHEVDVLTFHEGDDPDIPHCRILRIPKVPVDRVRPGFSAKKLACDAVMLWEALRRVRRNRYDLVHAVEESAFMALLTRRLFKVPYVYDMDSGLAEQMAGHLPRLRRLFEWFERRAVRGSIGTLAVCGALASRARTWHPDGFVACVEDVSLLAAGDPGRDALPGLTPPGWEGHPVVLYVGNLQVYQGIDLLLAAFARASREVPEARLLLVGGAPERVEHYREACRGLGIGESVNFAGPRPVELLGACFARATVLVSPRVQGTNTPMKVYSYLDSGRAVLATRLPTHTQVLDDEVALLAEPEPEAMARGLVRLLSDPGLRERLATNAKDFARRELTFEAYEGKLLRFYDAIEKKIGGGTAHGEIAGLEARH
ncbi:MAG TPA: glycosyltransferase family 4 protein [Thermoanaerobaculia bacterium]